MAHAKGQTLWENNEKVTQSRICIFFSFGRLSLFLRLFLALSVSRKIVYIYLHIYIYISFWISQSRTLPSCCIHPWRLKESQPVLEIGASNWFVRTKLMAQAEPLLSDAPARGPSLPLPPS